ncbi:PspC domain-containing protein [Pedobacter sp. MW01-1-1]|uniref:PspC domain-containing protein n=1 Tax=Pedobacter sp. MW01-1-1 TaxID=3383027 RepID=UPI003FEDCB79
MEKTIIINIGNTIIHIEESAYELLKAYLNEVKHYFANHADDLEIVTDIENRIAELLNEQLLTQKKQVVGAADVQAVILQMGRVQDFDTELEEGREAPVEEPAQFSVPKKLYRDMNNRAISGVCSGIGHYFDIEAKWVRLLMILLTFFGGSGLFIYLILWIIMPQANSRVERMEMKGEPANLQGFQKNLDQELENLQMAKKSSSSLFGHFGNFLAEFFEWLGRFLSGTGKVIFKIIAGCIIFFGCFFLLALILSFGFLMGFSDEGIYSTLPFSMVEEGHRTAILWAALVIIFIPLLALVLFSIRVAFNRQAINKTLSFALLIVWLIGVCFGGYYVSRVLSGFKQHAEITQTINLHNYPEYVLDLDKKRFFNPEDSLKFKIDKQLFKNSVVVEDLDQDGPFVNPYRVRIAIEKSLDNKVRVVEHRQSHGKTFENALQNAQSISYVYDVKDSLISFNSFFKVNETSLWRDQEMKIQLYVPIGTKIVLKRDLYRYMDNIWCWECEEKEGKDANFSTWIMTENGLKCAYIVNHPEEEQNH